jgi:hypothetical protein
VPAGKKYEVYDLPPSATRARLPAPEPGNKLERELYYLKTASPRVQGGYGVPGAG